MSRKIRIILATVADRPRVQPKVLAGPQTGQGPPELQGRSKTFGEKIAKDGKGALGFPILSDPNHKTIDNYGLFDTTYVGKGVEGIPHPAIYILDKNRKIVWAKIEYDYKKRPTNEDIRAELAKLK